DDRRAGEDAVGDGQARGGGGGQGDGRVAVGRGRQGAEGDRLVGPVRVGIVCDDPGLDAVAAIVGTQVQGGPHGEQVSRVRRAVRVDRDLGEAAAAVSPQLSGGGEEQGAAHRRQ